MSTPTWRRALAAAAATVAALAVSTAGSGLASAEDAQQAPVLAAEGAEVVADQYIVVMRQGANANANRIAAAAEARRNGAQILNEYSAALQGFAARLPQRALDALRGNVNIEYIEADQVMRINTTQTPATWGIDRIDQRNLPLSDSYTYSVTGAGVTAYIIDTGVRFSHNEFGGRAVSGFDAIDGGSADDCHGHGTHVAGTVGGTAYGVAKAVSVVGVRVLNCRGSGTNSQVIKGIDWVTDDHGAG
ncbi:MAG: S8 family serine peptidase, partial [Actinomycetota bacterium]|nr:S8 family serine peptidase [Actinomycetota bacterium]